VIYGMFNLCTDRAIQVCVSVFQSTERTARETNHAVFWNKKYAFFGTARCQYRKAPSARHFRPTVVRLTAMNSFAARTGPSWVVNFPPD